MNVKTWIRVNEPSEHSRVVDKNGRTWEKTANPYIWECTSETLYLCTAEELKQKYGPVDVKW